MIMYEKGNNQQSSMFSLFFSKVDLSFTLSSFLMHFSLPFIFFPYYSTCIKISKTRILYLYTATFVIQNSANCHHPFSCLVEKIMHNVLTISCMRSQLERKLYSANNNGKSWLKVFKLTIKCTVKSK